jgi:hypothetical protein
MGGVGKTELATQYASTHEADYPGGICWLNARDTNLAAEILQFAQLYMNLEVPQELGARPLNLEEQVAWCWQNWYTPQPPLVRGELEKRVKGECWWCWMMSLIWGVVERFCQGLAAFEC